MYMIRPDCVVCRRSPTGFRLGGISRLGVVVSPVTFIYKDHAQCAAPILGCLLYCTICPPTRQLLILCIYSGYEQNCRIMRIFELWGLRLSGADIACHPVERKLLMAAVGVDCIRAPLFRGRGFYPRASSPWAWIVSAPVCANDQTRHENQGTPRTHGPGRNRRHVAWLRLCCARARMQSTPTENTLMKPGEKCGLTLVHPPGTSRDGRCCQRPRVKSGTSMAALRAATLRSLRGKIALQAAASYTSISNGAPSRRQ